MNFDVCIIGAEIVNLTLISLFGKILPVYKYLDGINQGDLFFCFLDQTNSTSTYP